MPIDHSFVLTSSTFLTGLSRELPIDPQRRPCDGWVAYIAENLRFWYRENGSPGQLPQETDDPDIVFVDEDYRRLIPWTDKGYRTIWLNRAGGLLPYAMPKHDLELHRIDELEEVESIVQTPMLSQCLSWWDEWQLPVNIRQHASKVAWAAYVLAVQLRERGERVNPILAHRGGILHDLDKIQTLGMTNRHGAMGAEFLEGHGYPTVAEIVREHIMHTILDPQSDMRSWEVKLVFFCDKLTEDDALVTLDERFSALGQRYPVYKKKMDEAKEHVWGLNDEICSVLGYSDNQSLVSDLNERYRNMLAAQTT